MADNYEGRVFRGPGFVLDAPTSYGAMVEEREKFFNRHKIGRKRRTLTDARAESYRDGLRDGLERAFRDAPAGVAILWLVRLIKHVEDTGRLPGEADGAG